MIALACIHVQWGDSLPARSHSPSPHVVGEPAGRFYGSTRPANAALIGDCGIDRMTGQALVLCCVLAQTPPIAIHPSNSESRFLVALVVSLQGGTR